MLARAIRGSNSIEGYHVEVDDAVAALDDESSPLSADERTFAEIRGYRQALGYVLAMAGDEQFVLDASAIRSMHFMMLAHDVAKSPGSYRAGPVYVSDGGDQVVVYEGPEASLVPGLMDELVSALALHADMDLYALLGYRLRRSAYVKRAEIEERTATRDFKRLVDLGLLSAVGETKARHYVAAKRLQALRQDALADIGRRIEDPYPWLRAKLHL